MSESELQREAYHYFSEVTTRWKDNDIYGHVNNVSYYSYFDSVANQYLIEKGGLDIQTAEVVGFVVASECKYLAPITYPETIEVGLRVNKLGNSSVEYGLAIFRENDKNKNSSAIAHGSFTHVFVNRKTNKSSPIPDTIRDALNEIHTTN